MQGHVQSLNRYYSPLSSACCFFSLLFSSSSASYAFFAAAFSSCNFTKAEPSLQVSYEGKEIPCYKQKPPIKRLQITSRSYSEPWGIHPVGALRSAPTGRSPNQQSLQHKTPNNFKKLLGALGATPSGCTKKCPHWKITKSEVSTT